MYSACLNKQTTMIQVFIVIVIIVLSIAVHNKWNCGDKPDCFPAASAVTTPSGPQRMDELRIGDRVLTATGTYDPVERWLHREPASRMQVLRLATKAGPTLVCSPKHVVLRPDKSVYAAELRVGDEVVLGTGETTRLRSIAHGAATGKYAPLTASGTVVVDGVRCSCAAHTSHQALRVFQGLLPFTGWSTKTDVATRFPATLLQAVA